MYMAKQRLIQLINATTTSRLSYEEGMRPKTISITKIECERCNRTFDELDKDAIVEHQAHHGMLELLSVGDRIEATISLGGDSGGSQYGDMRATIIEISESEMRLLIELDDKERHWIPVWRVRNK